MRSLEGLIRKLLKENRDLIITYTFMQDMYNDMIDEIAPASISEFEELADHYKIGYVWMGDSAQHVLTIIGGELEPFNHHIEIEVVH